MLLQKNHPSLGNEKLAATRKKYINRFLSILKSFAGQKILSGGQIKSFDNLVMMMMMQAVPKPMMNVMQILCGVEVSSKLELLELTPPAAAHLQVHQLSSIVNIMLMMCKYDLDDDQ